MIDTSQSNGQLYFVQFTLNFSFSASKIQITNEQTQQIRAEGFWRWVCLMLLTAEAFVSWNLKFIFGDGWFMFGQGRGIVGLMWGKWSLLWLWEPRSDVTLPVSPVSPAHEYSAPVTSHNNDIMTPGLRSSAASTFFSNSAIFWLHRKNLRLLLLLMWILFL